MMSTFKPCLYLTLAIGAISVPVSAYAQSAEPSQPAQAEPAVSETPGMVNNLLPDNAQLAAPEAEVQTAPVAEGAPTAPEMAGDVVPSGEQSPTPQPGAINDIGSDDIFYDADSLVPTTEMGRKTLRKVNPAMEPASRMIIVKQDSSASSHQANLISANRAMKLGRYDAALQMFESLLQKNKNDVNALMGRAVSLQNLERYDEAILAYDAVLAVRPDYKDARINKMGLVGEKYPAVALRQLTDMYNENPDDVGIIAQLALAHAQLGEAQEALKFLGIAASKEPQNANHVYNMAIVADRAGMKKQAIEFYEGALEIDTIYSGGRSLPRDQVYTRLAQLR